MGLDLWFREDVARILASTQETMHNSLGAVPPLDPEKADAYQQGFGDALRAVAVAFGVCPSEELVRLSHAAYIVDVGGTRSGSNGAGRRR